MSRLLATLALAAGLLGSYASPPVRVELRTSWPAAQLVLEALEAITTEEPDAFFPLLHAITDPDNIPDSRKETSQSTLEHVLQAATSLGYLSEPGAYASAEMNIALHAASPKLEAFYQYYGDEVTANANCGSWVDWYGEAVCDIETLKRVIEVETIDSAEDITPSRPKLLPFDHVLPEPSSTLEPPPRTAILYGKLDSPNFRALHTYLYNAAPHVAYVFRPAPSPRDQEVRSYLSGYGVGLDLKKMEYLALDDRNQASDADVDAGAEKVSTGESDPIAALLQQYPEDITVDATTALTDEEILQIAVQATQLINDADDAEKLNTLKQLSQNFPKYATTLARRVVPSDALVQEITANNAKASGGANLAWLNGVVIDERDMTPFGLLRALRRERGIMQSLTRLGLSTEQALELLTHPTIGKSQSDGGVTEGLYDASDRPEGGNVVAWFNDMETDDRYAGWGGSIRMILRQLYPGQFPSLKFNLFNIVIAVDLSHTSSLDFLGHTVNGLINRGLPFRWGVVPLVETEEGQKMAHLFYYLMESFGPETTLSFFSWLSPRDVPIETLKPYVDWAAVRARFANLLATQGEVLSDDAERDLDKILAGPAMEGAPSPWAKQNAYAKRLGATAATATQGHTFVNGKHFALNDDFLRGLQTVLTEQLQHLQFKVYRGEIGDEEAAQISTYFYDLPTTALRRNMYIQPTGKSSVRIFSLPELLGRRGLKLGAESFVYPDSKHVHLTMYIAGDFDSESGRQLVKEALVSMTPEQLYRITFLHNPSRERSTARQSSTSSLLVELISQGLLSRVPPERLLAALGLAGVATTDDSAQSTMEAEDKLQDVLGGALLEGAGSAEARAFLVATQFLLRDLKVQPGAQVVIVNGRAVGPIKEGDFTSEDFDALAKFEYNKRVRPVYEAITAASLLPEDTNREDEAELVSMISSVISSIQVPDPSQEGLFDAPFRPRLRNYRLLDGNYTSFVLGNETTAHFQFALLVDPLTEQAQKWSSLMEWALNIPGVSVEVRLNPGRHRQLPLKRFYRYNLLPRLAFDDAGEEIRSKAEFTHLPIEPIYTLAMDVPQSWLVRPRKSQYDLDNIQLGALSARDRASGVQALFDLDYLVVEGHARDSGTQMPPRGVQLQLVRDNSTTPIADTQVVANLGYLQFRTGPGVYQLEIRPGRGRDIYKMESVGNEGWHSLPVEEVGTEVTVMSFDGITLYPRLARLPGKELEDVLVGPKSAQEGNEGLVGNIMSRVTSFFGTKEKPVETSVQAVDDGQAEINIFTVASGLLYERFASIMILSVLRHTKSSVKFWFIENFLSPSFLEFIPHFAAEYGFQYELVTYKWPSWLRAQKEKQRIIWAYKILFLDVLFPMDLKKVIFVDADQIVRADLKELVDLDLHGAPYGYTPMGDDNYDMEGFRFWKTGYWKEFLQGLPYHISALYVVDLVRFRQVAAGDILRQHYQQLSADPNSLANLDQDLPNNLQREVPIFSLPEDWLWCETWCSKDRLHRAKTIDLCQNPLTKEPKLARARQIPEWEKYDAEIANLTRRFGEEGRLESALAAVDVNVLADASGGKIAPAPSSSSEDASEATPQGDGGDSHGDAPIRDEL